MISSFWTAKGLSNFWVQITGLLKTSKCTTIQSSHSLVSQSFTSETFSNHKKRFLSYHLSTTYFYICCRHHLSESSITNEILFLCSSCFTCWLSAQCSLFRALPVFSQTQARLHALGWTMSAFQAVTEQFFREVLLYSPRGIFTSLFSEEQRWNFRHSRGCFNQWVPPEKIQSPVCFLLPSFSFSGFHIACFYLNKLCYLNLPFKYALSFPGKPNSSPSSNSKPASCSSVTVFLDEDFSNASK